MSENNIKNEITIKTKLECNKIKNPEINNETKLEWIWIINLNKKPINIYINKDDKSNNVGMEKLFSYISKKMIEQIKVQLTLTENKKNQGVHLDIIKKYIENINQEITNTMDSYSKELKEFNKKDIN